MFQEPITISRLSRAAIRNLIDMEEGADYERAEAERVEPCFTGNQFIGTQDQAIRCAYWAKYWSDGYNLEAAERRALLRLSDRLVRPLEGHNIVTGATTASFDEYIKGVKEQFKGWSFFTRSGLKIDRSFYAVVNDKARTFRRVNSTPSAWNFKEIKASIESARQAAEAITDRELRHSLNNLRVVFHGYPWETAPHRRRAGMETRTFDGRGFDLHEMGYVEFTIQAPAVLLIKRHSRIKNRITHTLRATNGQVWTIGYRQIQG